MNDVHWKGLLLTIILLAVTAGCAQSPSGGCNGFTPGGPFGALVFPASGSTNVPAAIGTLVIQGGLFAGGRAEVATQAGMLIIDAPIGPAPSPLPTPLATPAGLVGGYGSVTVPQLAPHTTYVVSVTSHCDTVPFGAFTTQ